MAGQIPQFMTDQIPQFMPDQIPQFVTAQISQLMTDQIPQFVTAQIPQFMIKIDFGAETSLHDLSHVFPRAEFDVLRLVHNTSYRRFERDLYNIIIPYRRIHLDDLVYCRSWIYALFPSVGWSFAVGRLWAMLCPKVLTKQS